MRYPEVCTADDVQVVGSHELGIAKCRMGIESSSCIPLGKVFVVGGVHPGQTRPIERDAVVVAKTICGVAGYKSEHITIGFIDQKVVIKE